MKREIRPGPYKLIIAEVRGELAEQKVKLALKKLEEKGIIQSWGWFGRFSKNDFLGRDFVMYPRQKSIYLQVKSHIPEEKKKALKEIEPEIWFKGGIYWIEVPPAELEERVEGKILRILEIAEDRAKYKKYKEQK